MVVAGISSAGRAGDRGPTVGLDVHALGYQAGEVHYFSYASDGGPYHPDDTYGPIHEAALALDRQLRDLQLREPGREVDLIAHSQGGVVVDEFLKNVYKPADPALPPLGTVVTLSSPHQGAPLATAADDVRSTPLGTKVLGEIGARLPAPPPNSPAVRDLSERSPTIRRLQRAPLPDQIDFTTIGATEDVVVPADHIGVAGARATVVPVEALSEHTAITTDPDALRAVRAALEGRPPPCVGIVTALRAAIAPVVISRLSHTFGSVAHRVLGGVP
jgi:triacylglycerol esterase/lipase EstA (alpha/beta hydrolase family)